MSDICKRSALPWALGSIMDSSPDFSRNLLTQDVRQIYQEKQLQSLALAEMGLFAATPLFPGTWPHLRGVPVVFNFKYHGHAVQVVLS